MSESARHVDHMPSWHTANEGTYFVNGYRRMKDCCNLLKDIYMLNKDVENISFVYCTRSINELTNRISKETKRSCIIESCHY